MYASEQDFVSVINEWTEGIGVDVAIDNLGGDILQKTINAVRLEGIIVSMGFMTGTQVTIDVRNFFFLKNSYEEHWLVILNIFQDGFLLLKKNLSSY